MPVNDILYRNNLAAAGDTKRHPSPQLWAGCPTREIVERDGGVYFFDDFNVSGNYNAASSAVLGSMGQWAVYADTVSLVQSGQDISGTVADLEGGWLTIGAADDNEGVTLFSTANAIRMITTNSTTAPNYQNKIWFECRLSRSTIAATKFDAFVGLAAGISPAGVPTAALPISTTINQMSTTPSFFGFMSAGSTAGTPAGPTELSVTFNKASGTVNYPTNLTALMAATSQTVLAAGTIVKVGFLYDPAALFQNISSATARQTAGVNRRKLIRFFVNGIEAPAFLSSDDLANATGGQAFPIVPMGPTIAIMNDAGSSPGTLGVDWIKCVALPNS